MALALPCRAQSAPATDGRLAELEARLERSSQLIDVLSRRVQQLEAAAVSRGGVPTAATPAQTPAPAPAVAPAAAPPPAPLAPLAALAPAGGAALPLHGFADIGVVNRSRKRAGGAYVGSLDLYMTPQFGERAKGLVELVFEVDGDGRLVTDLERLQIGYAFSDALTLWGGRFHTPFGIWNTSFHHGMQIQTAATRPRFLDFEDAGGVLPVHTVGAWATGSAKLARGRVSYDLYVGNPPTIALEDPADGASGVLDVGVGGSRSRDLSVGANVSWSPSGVLEGLSVGVHGLRSTVQDSAVQPSRTRLGLAGAALAYLNHDWEVLAELYHFRNVQLGSARAARTSQAAYVQVGHTFGDWTPYGRLERASFDQADPYFAQQASGASYARDVLGVRYDLTSTLALKLEGARTTFRDRDLGRASEVRSQLAVRF